MRLILMLPKLLVGGLVLFAISVMLYGVFSRYVLVPVTDWLDWDPPNFFWVEEVGETALAWLTLVGAAIAVKERGHFALTLFTPRLPARAQVVIHVLHNLIIAAFGGLIAYVGWGLVKLNATLESPALEISLGWIYASTVVGGILMVLYALDQARRTGGPEHSFADVRE